MQEIRVHTNFTNTIAQQHVIPLAELRSVEARALLRNCFVDPERLLPTETRESASPGSPPLTGNQIVPY